MWTIIAVGLFNSVMFPTHFHARASPVSAPHGRRFRPVVAAIVGGAIIPEMQGMIADRIGIHHAFFLPILCYALHHVLRLRRLAEENQNCDLLAPCEKRPGCHPERSEGSAFPPAT